VEFGSSSELDRVVSARFPSPVRFACARRIVPGLGSASPGVLAPVETPLRQVPLLTRTAVRPSGKTKVARPSSVPSSGFLPLSTVQAAHAARHEPLAEPAVTPWRPDASRPCYMPLASLWSCPAELSLPEEPYLLSQAVASLRVRIRPPPARRDRDTHDRFPRRACSLPEPARRRTRTHER